MAEEATQNSELKNMYFNLHVNGVGYLSRIRDVEHKGNKSYLACTVAALRGAKDSVEYTYFDCTIPVPEAQQLVNKYRQHVEAGEKVLVGFTIGDPNAQSFTYQSGKQKGETGVTIKGRLLYIRFVKVGTEFVYKAPKKENDKESSVSE